MNKTIDSGKFGVACCEQEFYSKINIHMHGDAGIMLLYVPTADILKIQLPVR